MNTALVTGANQPVGRELCRLLKQRSYDVVAVCKETDSALEALGVRIEAGIDVAADDSVRTLSERIGHTRIDLLIHSAGIARSDSFDHFDSNSIVDHMQTNSIGPLRVTRTLRRNIGRGSKVVIAPPPLDADGPGDEYLAYEMARAALGVAVANLSTEFERLGIALAILGPVQGSATDAPRPVASDPSALARTILDRVASITAGEEALNDLSSLVNLSAGDLETLRRTAPRTQPWANAIVEDFYDTLYQHSRTARVFAEGERTERQATLRDWYLAVTSGKLDAAFWRKQWTVGLVHVRRQVKNTYMIAMMGRVQLNFFHKCWEEFGAREAERVCAAFKRVTDIVTGLIVEGYLENYAQAMENVAGFRRRLIQRMIDMEVRRMLEAARHDS